jgi:hypothetical protein
MKKKGCENGCEAESDTAKIKALRQHISELEQLLGQKQFEIDFFEKANGNCFLINMGLIEKKTFWEALTWYWEHRGEHRYKMNKI